MPMLRVALAQIDLTVGDLAGNSAAVLAGARAAAAAGADLVAFPEMCLTGYPPEDLVFRQSFRTASRQALTALVHDLSAAGLAELAVVVGYLDGLETDDRGVLSNDTGPRARNSAAFCLGGRVVCSYDKHHLPTYGVFDEARYFRPGSTLPVLRFRGVDVAMTICEDAWQIGAPFTTARAAKAGLVININGSPYERNKEQVRLPLLGRRAREANATVAFVNQVGGQDELVFDGDSFVVAPDGSVLARAAQYQPELLVVDLNLPAASAALDDCPVVAGLTVQHLDTGRGSGAPRSGAPPAVSALSAPVESASRPIAAPLSEQAQVWGALVLGLRDYVTKNGFASVVLGVSGGIDSAVCAVLAADALGGERVYGVSMPSKYSSAHSRSDAADLCQRIGAQLRTIPIESMVDAFVTSLALTGVAEENVQARVRGTTLMGLSNAEGHLVLAPGNKSELAVGYSTIYGDAVGGFGPIKDVFKTEVYRLARWRNENARTHGMVEPIPPNSISKPPSAELRPGQQDTDSLPEYEVLDAVLVRYIDGDTGLADLVAAGFDRTLVTRLVRMVDAAEWKRRQYPPGPKISLKNFGRDRRLPITNRWRER